MKHPPLTVGQLDAPHRRRELGNLRLESGEVLRDAQVSYVIHGDPHKLAHDAVLVTTSIGGNHHRLDFLIGPGNALDTNRYCIVAVDAIGNGLSSSPSNAHASQRGPAFPRFTIRDMVASQRALIESLGVVRLRAVVGASMGGMQVLQWGVSHPEIADVLVAITPTARTPRWSQLVNEMSRRALFVDDACRVLRERQCALRLWLPLTQLVMTRTPEAVEEMFTESDLAGWLRQRVQSLLREDSLDPFDWCYQTWAYDAHDVGAPAPFCGDTSAALASIRAPTLVCAPALDLYNPAAHARWLAGHIERARFVELPGHDGHLAAGGLAEPATSVLRHEIAGLLGCTPRLAT